MSQTSWGAAQSRCLYNMRQAFHTMQADLDPLLKGAYCLLACRYLLRARAMRWQRLRCRKPCRHLEQGPRSSFETSTHDCIMFLIGVAVCPYLSTPKCSLRLPHKQ